MREEREKGMAPAISTNCDEVYWVVAGKKRRGEVVVVVDMLSSTIASLQCCRLLVGSHVPRRRL